MTLLEKRRTMLSEPWRMLRSGFTDYAINNKTNGSVFSVVGDYVQAVSDGQNKNNSQFYLSHRIPYADIQNKTCRITWVIEASEPIDTTGTNSSGNITLFVGPDQDQTGELARTSKKDITTAATFLGHHSVVFIPSEIMAGLDPDTYFGWNIGFRSKTANHTVRIRQVYFEVLD